MASKHFRLSRINITRFFTKWSWKIFSNQLKTVFQSCNFDYEKEGGEKRERVERAGEREGGKENFFVSD